MSTPPPPSPQHRRWALVTGASGGIGRELARELARAGCGVVLVSRRGDRLAELAEELRQEHAAMAEVIAQDLSVPGSPDHLIAELDRRSVIIDVLVNNAGFAVHGLFAETCLAQQLELLQLNLVSLTHLTRLLLPGMIQRRWGRVLNVASIAAYMPGPLMATYFASKAYVLSFSEALANELRGTGVTVTALCPGPTRTGFETRAGLSHTRAFRGPVMDPAAVARIGYRAMMKGNRVVIPGLRNKLRMLPISLVPRRALAHFASKYHER